MGELEPGFGKGEFEFRRIGFEAEGDLVVTRVGLQRDVGGEHDGRMTLCGVVGVGDGVGGLTVGGNPLGGTGGALRLHPFIGEEVFEVLHTPSGGRG